jgi:hypothetical protein
MRITELKLTSPQKLEVSGTVFTLSWERFANRDDALRLTSPTGEERHLVGVVDVSQQIDNPRIHILTGSSSDNVLVFGGEHALRLSNQGVEGEIATFRDWRNTELWSTEFFSCAEGMVSVYESGILLVDEALAVRWHDPKYLNDVVQRVSSNTITLLRDGEMQWTITLADGSASIPAHLFPRFKPE